MGPLMTSLPAHKSGAKVVLCHGLCKNWKIFFAFKEKIPDSESAFRCRHFRVETALAAGDRFGSRERDVAD